jgi:amino acid transporter
MADSAGTRLVRGIHRWDLVALVINSIIGAGIFGLPARAYALAGTYSLAAYLVAAIAIFLVILCFAEVGSRFNASGGPYLYARATFGPLVGFQVGWLLWLGRIAAAASLSNLFVGYVGFFIPAAGIGVWRSVIIVSLIAALTVVNIVGIRATTTVTNVLTVGKLIPLMLVGIGGLFFIDAARYSGGPPGYTAFSQTALLLVFTYMGFEGAAIPAGEVREPGRHLPFALMVGLAIVFLTYVLVQVVCIGILPDLARSERPLADASLRFLGAPGASLISLGALLSMGGTINALTFASPRILFAMAENGQLPGMFLATHPAFRTPVVAIVVTSAVTLSVALVSSFVSALTISAIVRLIAYATTCAALLVLRRRDTAGAGFTVRGGEWVAVSALVLSVWLLSNSPLSEMRVAVMALVMGIVVYMGARICAASSLS